MKLTVQVSKNFKAIEQAVKDNTRVLVLSGGTRSRKTYDSLLFIAYYCTINENKNILCLRETYNIAKELLMDVFMEILTNWNVEYTKRAQTLTVNGNKISFKGADAPFKFKGLITDIALIDEANEQNVQVYNQIRLRSEGLTILTRNPSYYEDWVDNVLKDPATVRVQSTFKDNPTLSANERQNILSKEPTKENEDSGTADLFDWKVYGLGIAGRRDGSVYKYNEADKIPEGTEFLAYGIDFGFRDELAVSAVHVKEIPDGQNHLYIEQIYYQKGATLDDLTDYFKDNKIGLKGEYMICDSASPLNIQTIANKGFYAIPCYKFHNSILQGIKILQGYKLFVVGDAPDLKTEFNNYVWAQTTSGQPLNKPVDKFNHLLDTVRYVAISYFTEQNTI